jgi:hypothetical protein
MTWEYDVRKAEFYKDGVFMFNSEYAGTIGYYNDPAKECVKNKGPLPRGKYTIGAPYNSTKTGPYTLPLIPDSSNNMCGRDEFRIHGDSRRDPGTASEGCIILIIKHRKKIYSSKDTDLLVK